MPASPAPMVARVLFGLLVASPAWWLLGIDWLLYPLALCGLALALPAVRRPPLDRWQWLLALLVLWLLFCLLLALLRGDVPTMRGLAAAHNLVLLATGLAVVRVVEAIATSGVPPAWPRYLARLGVLVAVGAIALPLAVPAPATGLQLPTLFGALTGRELPGLLGEAQIVEILDPYSFPALPLGRPVLLGMTTMAATLIIPLLAAAALAHGLTVRDSTTAHDRRILGWLAALFIAAALVSMSRSVYLGLCAGLVAYLLASGVRWQQILAGALVAAGLGALWLLGEGLGRAGSTELRVWVYAASFEALDAAGYLTGVGFRPEGLTEPNIPVGSHSTPLSLLVRGGLPALLVGAVLFWGLPWWHLLRTTLRLRRAQGAGHTRCAQARLLLLHAVLGMISVWLLFADIDAYALVTVLVFIVLAIFWQPDRLHRWVVGEARWRAQT